MRKAHVVAALFTVFALAACANDRPTRPADISVAKDFKIEAVVEDLAGPPWGPSTTGDGC